MMGPKFNVGDLVTHQQDNEWIGIVLEISNRSIDDIPCWYCKVHFPSGFQNWINDSMLVLQAGVKNEPWIENNKI